MNRTAWKIYYRLLRIARREARKAYMDALLYGVGYVYVDPEGTHHVPAGDVRIA